MAGAARLPPLRRVVEGKESEDETAAPKPRNPVAGQLRLATVREGDLRWIAPSVSFDLSEFNPCDGGIVPPHLRKLIIHHGVLLGHSLRKPSANSPRNPGIVRYYPQRLA